MRRITRMAALALALWCTASIAGSSPSWPPVPALNDPATGEHLRGKFIFADFFTSDIEASKRFYGSLFGWEWRWESPDRSYGIFYQGNIAVAGVVLQEATDTDRPYGRWIYYLSTEQVPKKVADIVAAGGRVLLEPRSMPDRGTLAVVADAEGALFGLLDSSSGDPADYRSAPGEWLWVSLYSQDVEGASRFYQSQFGYEITEAYDSGDELDFFLSKGGFARAAISHLSAESGSHPTWVGYVQVDDVAASVARAVELGGEVLLGPDPAVLAGNLAIVSDPIGAPIALIHWTYDDPEAAQ